MDNSKQTHAWMRSQRLMIGAAAATLTLAAGGAAFGYHLTHSTEETHSSMSAPESNEQSTQSSPSPAEASATTESPAPTEATPTAPACEDGSPTPIGTCLYPASVQWLPDLLPDPREVDRTDPEAVARAYVITRNTWDASRAATRRRPTSSTARANSFHSWPTAPTRPSPSRAATTMGSSRTLTRRAGTGTSTTCVTTRTTHWNP